MTSTCLFAISKPTSHFLISSMSHFLFKPIFVRNDYLYYFQSLNVSSLTIRWFSTNSEDDKRKSFVVSYLKHSLDFSHEVALLTSKSIKFDFPDKPNKAIEFLRNNGFNQTQIAKLVRAFPNVLVSDTQKTILPKFEFLKAKGVSESDMANILSYSPKILSSSLNNQIIPSYDQLRNFFQCDKRTINVVRRFPDIIGCRWNKVVANANVLQDHGVPDIHIASWIEYNPRSLIISLDRIREAIEEVSNMGFDASRWNFASAVRVFAGMKKSTWDSKIKMFLKCGFSEDEVSKVFRRSPISMSYSEQKISGIMQFFAEEMNWRPSMVATHPSILGLSLKKRISPRCSVYKVLRSKGLVKYKVSLRTLLGKSEEQFVKIYVERFEKAAPELLELYKKKLDI